MARTYTDPRTGKPLVALGPNAVAECSRPDRKPAENRILQFWTEYVDWQADRDALVSFLNQTVGLRIDFTDEPLQGVRATVLWLVADQWRREVDECLAKVAG